MTVHARIHIHYSQLQRNAVERYLLLGRVATPLHSPAAAVAAVANTLARRHNPFADIKEKGTTSFRMCHTGE